MRITDSIGDLEWSVDVNSNGDTVIDLMDAPNALTLDESVWKTLVEKITYAIDIAQDQTEYEETEAVAQ